MARALCLTIFQTTENDMRLIHRSPDSKRGYIDGYAVGVKDVLKSIEELVANMKSLEFARRESIESRLAIRDYHGAATAADDAERYMMTAVYLTDIETKHTRLLAQVLLSLGKAA